MISILSALWIYGVLSAEDPSIPLPIRAPPKKQSFLPIELTAMVVEYLQCDDAALAHFSETNRDNYEITKPLLIILKESLSIQSLQRSLNEIIRISHEKEIELPSLGAGREIDHYLDGFEGHIDWLMEFLKTANQDDVGIKEQIDDFQTRLTRHKIAYPRSVPLHLRDDELTDAQRELFDAFFVMKDKAMKIIAEERRIGVPPIKCAEAKLLVEEIGVVMSYTALQEMRWQDERRFDSSPAQWFDIVTSLRRRAGDIMYGPTGKRWANALTQHLQEFADSLNAQRLAFDRDDGTDYDSADSSASDPF